jgi:4-amino-4-deoxy-L-arabinose transferase-like glycosyltransferase
VKRPTWVLLIAILLIATALRLYRIADIPLRADEATNLYIASNSPDQIIHTFTADDPHMPLYYLILHYWMSVAGQSEISARYPTVFVAIIAVALTFVVGKQLFPRSPNIALIGAFFTAINPSLVWDSQEIYMYSLLTACAIASSVLFLRVIKPNSSRIEWIAYVCINILGLFTHYLAVLVIATEGALWILWGIQRALTRTTIIRWFIAQIITAIIFLPWLVLSSSATSFQFDFFRNATLPELLWRSVVSFSVGRMDGTLMPRMIDPPIGSALTIGFLILFVIGLAAKSSNNDAPARIALVTFIIVPIGLLIVYGILRFPLLDERYELFLIPAFMLIVARGTERLASFTYARWTPALAIVFVVASSGYSLNNYFHVPEYAKSPDWHAFMQQLVANAQPGDVLIQNYPDPALPYYLDNRMPRILLPRTGSATAEQVNADLIRITTKYNRVWLQPASFSTWDTDGLVETWLMRHAKQISKSDFRGLSLEQFIPAPIALLQAQPINATFARQIQMVAFDKTGVLEPGNIIHITLYWKTASHIERAATVFIHIYDDQGRLVTQQDATPVNGTFPTNEWESNTIIVDQYQLAIPTGTRPKTLSVGMYDSQTQVRLDVTDVRGQVISDKLVRLEER